MTIFDDDAFNAWLKNETIQSLLHGLWEAEKTARSANDPATRETARTALGAAAGAFLKATGVTEQLRQQMLEHVLGELDDGAACAGKTFEELTRPEMARTKGGLAVLRGLAERGVMTLFALLGAHFSAATVGELRGIGQGREGIFTFIAKARFARDSGPAHALQEETVTRLGYTVGAEATQLRKAMLMRGVAHYNTRAAERGMAPVRRSTMRDWCQRAYARRYQNAQREGAEARRTGTVDLKLLL